MLWKRLEVRGIRHRKWRLMLALMLAPFAAFAFIGSGWMARDFGSLAEQRWDFVCLAVALLGIAMRVTMAGHGQIADPGKFLADVPLRTDGFYSLIRHPDYLANFLIQLGVVLLLKSVLFTALAVVVAYLYYERLALAKERMMLKRHGDQFSAWAKRTPLLIPQFSTWVKPATNFDFRMALRGEAVTFAFMGLSFFVLETLEGTMLDGLPFWEWVEREPHWIGLLLVGGAIFWTQLSRVWAVAMLVMTSLAFGAWQLRTVLPFSYVQNEHAAMEALSSGGYVLLLRHALTTGNDQVVDMNDCSTQRVLSDIGREQARVIGRMLREQGIRFARTISSQYCRAQETAKLVGAEAVETMSNLNEQPIHLTLLEQLFGQSDKDERILRPIREAIRDWRGEGNLLLVSHAGIIRNLTYDSLHMGEGFVLKPDPQSREGFTVVGKILQPAGRN